MQQIYLDMDSKGIFPKDLEGRAEYLVRGMQLQEISSNNCPKMIDALNSLKGNNRYEITPAAAPEGAYEKFEDIFGADVRWVPYFKATRKGLINKVRNFFSTNTGICANFFDKDTEVKSPMVLIYISEKDKEIAIHELIHSVRKDLDYPYVKEFRVGSELFAYNGNILPIHEVFLKHPVTTFKIAPKLRKARKKLRDCFGDKGDYAFIRLNEGDVKCIAGLDDEKDIKSYFKKRTSNLYSIGEKLRFQIMCENVGL